MDITQTGSILIRLVDGTRQPLGDEIKWSAAIIVLYQKNIEAVCSRQEESGA
jgi:hypothetical protein